ncbi:hypothetical protein [Dyadobacter sp. CY356]|nr:hypothetical protein [Dyadobacter sp. CY356]MCF0057064.1 hypothetical protein [Dyadobacter sp. CY356]
MKNKILILIILSSLLSCDFICPPEEDKLKNDTSDSTTVKAVQIKDVRK